MPPADGSSRCGEIERRRRTVTRGGDLRLGNSTTSISSRKWVIIHGRTPYCPRMTMMPPRAGIVYTHNEGGVASCVREEERPPTPAAISKWRCSGTSVPAQEVDPKMSFGSGGVKASYHVADIWQQVCAAGTTVRTAAHGAQHILKNTVSSSAPSINNTVDLFSPSVRLIVLTSVDPLCRRVREHVLGTYEG